MTLKPSMTLDKDLYRRAYEQHQRWIEDDLADLPCDLLSRAKLWHEYLVAMANFDWDVLREPSDWARAQKRADLDHWYACVFRLEAWRHWHSKTS